MILAIDVGNTNVTIGCMEGENIRFIERLYTDTKKTGLEYAIALKNVLELYAIDPAALEGAVLSSVVPPVTATISDAVTKATGHQALLVGPGVKTGLDIKIDDPAQLGADLVVGAVAAIAAYPCPLVVVDLGTATTFTVVNQARQVIGGMILPGVQTSLHSLSSSTSQLPNISLDAPRQLIGRNTVDCMKSGILYGSAACVDGMLCRIEEALGQPVTAVATGGLAGSIVPLCRETLVVDDALLLRGLLLIYQLNRPTER